MRMPRSTAEGASRLGSVGEMSVLRGLAFVLLVSIVWGCGGDGEMSPSRRAADEAQTRTGDVGVTVELPHGWHAGKPADGNVIDPLTRVVASSAPVRLRQVPCQIARYALRPLTSRWSSSSGSPAMRRAQSRAPTASPATR